jgi:hypothetical protein
MESSHERARRLISFPVPLSGGERQQPGRRDKSGQPITHWSLDMVASEGRPPAGNCWPAGPSRYRAYCRTGR